MTTGAVTLRLVRVAFSMELWNERARSLRSWFPHLSCIELINHVRSVLSIDAVPRFPKRPTARLF
jgi:hypothetical protein